jgi:uncharacterized protein
LTAVPLRRIVAPPNKETTVSDKNETTMKQGDFCHVDIPVKDKERARAFYGEVFGWSFQEVPEMDYTLFTTPGKTVGGGLFTPGEQSPDKVVNYLLVTSIEESAKKVESFGGKTVSPKIEIPGHGWFMHVLDPEGNLLAMWESSH